MPSAVSGRQWPAESPTKKMPSSVAARSWCGIQLPWKRTASSSRSSASCTVVSFTWKRGSNEPTPMRSSSPAGKLQP